MFSDNLEKLKKIVNEVFNEKKVKALYLLIGEKG